MNKEIQTIQIGEVFTPVKQDGVFRRSIPKLVTPPLMLETGRITIPFEVHLLEWIRPYTCDRNSHLNFSTNSTLMEELGLIRIIGGKLPGEDKSLAVFTPDVANLARRLRLHLLDPRGRFEHEPIWEELNKGHLEFNPRPIVECPSDLLPVQLRFILAD